MIQLVDLCKSFEDKEVLKHIDSTFEAGKTNLIIGQSGSGKTVLMKCIVGLFSPSSGQILYDGRDFVSMKKRERVMLRREMGMVFQYSALFDSLTVEENVMFPLDMFSDESYKERRRRAKYCLDRVNLSEAGNKFPGEISGGTAKARGHCSCHRLEAQVSLLRRAELRTGPQDLVGDRRTHHSITQEYGTTTIINTHDMNSVMGIGEHILYIYEGRREWEGSKDEVMNADNERLNSFIFAF